MANKILCIGSKGFIGSNLVFELKKNPENMITEYVYDVTRRFNLVETFDIIYHLAANTDTTFSNDTEMYRNNIMGFLSVLDFAYKTNTRLIYASSGSIYGNDGKPLNAYGESKIVCDMLAKRYFDKIKIVGLRFFNVYGKGEIKKGKMASMITQWREQIKDGKRPVIFNGEYKRDFIYVKDVVKSLVESQKLESGIYDVGTGVATDFRDILNIVAKTMNVKIEPRFVENPYLDKYQTYTKANLDWGFKPDYTIESGIKDYFENYE